MILTFLIQPLRWGLRSCSGNILGLIVESNWVYAKPFSKLGEVLPQALPWARLYNSETLQQRLYRAVFGVNEMDYFFFFILFSILFVCFMPFGSGERVFCVKRRGEVVPHGFCESGSRLLGEACWLLGETC